jgi:hypothetical protein
VYLFRIEPFGYAGKPGNIGEEDGDLFAFSLYGAPTR